MLRETLEHARPTIKIFVSQDFGREETLRQLCYGIEEESIPWEIIPVVNGDAVTLAWEASQQSRLEAGVGLDNEHLVLHFAKLKKQNPLFQISVRSAQRDIRSLGANAARLVKKLPFKPLTE